MRKRLLTSFIAAGLMTGTLATGAQAQDIGNVIGMFQNMVNNAQAQSNANNYNQGYYWNGSPQAANQGHYFNGQPGYPNYPNNGGYWNGHWQNQGQWNPNTGQPCNGATGVCGPDANVTTTQGSGGSITH